MLDVHLHTTRGSTVHDEEGFSETSCSVRVGSKVSFTNTKHRKSDFPLWDKNLRFTISDPKNITLVVQVLDDIKKRVIGEVTIPFRSPIEGIEETRWYPFQNGPGEIKIGLTYKSQIEPPVTPKLHAHSAPPTVVTGPPPATPAMLIPFAPGDLQRELPPFAKGSYGVIYRGQAKGIQKMVVIKDIEIKDAKSIEDWKKEVNCMSMHRSPYIVEIFGYSSFGNIVAVIMEYMPKGDLYTILHKKSHHHPLSIIQRVRMARHVALGVNFLHKHNVMHRDVKSMNVLVSDDYTCKLTDFGCAKLVSSNQILNTMNAGTPMWMAPEVKSGAYGFPADVYSLGLVLYEMFEKILPGWDQIRQCIVIPGSFQSASMVVPCLNVAPHLRPTADEVCKVLDKMIRNMLLSVKDVIPASHQEKIKQVAGNDDIELYLHHLYRHLLSMPALEVDDLINKTFPLPAQAPKAYRGNPVIPQQPVHQAPYGMPPASVPYGVPIGRLPQGPLTPTGSPHLIGVPHGYPPGYPASYGSALQPPPTHM